MKTFLYLFACTCCHPSTLAQIKIGNPKITNPDAAKNAGVLNKPTFTNRVFTLPDDFTIVPADSVTGMYENSCKVTFSQPLHLPVAASQTIPGRSRMEYNGAIHVQIGQDRPGRFVGRQFSFQATADKINFNLSSQLLYNTPVNNLINTQVDFSGTDNHLLKLKDGSLMALRMAITRRDITPKPAWWNVEKMQTDGGNLFINQPNQRGATLFFKYDAKTSSWKQGNYIFDAANTLNGDFGVPRIANDANNKPMFSTYYIGGNDRPEFYQDPWTGRLYMTMWGSGGVTPEVKKNAVKPGDQPKIGDLKIATFVVYSDDLGNTWKLLDRVDNLLIVPMMITSTKEGRVFLAHEYNMFGADAAMVVRYNLKSDPTKLCTPIVIDKNMANYMLQTDSMAYMMDKYLIPQLTICRVGNDANRSVIRMAYNAIDKTSGRQFIKTGTLIVNSDTEGDYQYIPGASIKPGDAASSAVYPTLIEADPDAAGNATDISALYWIESTASNMGNAATKNIGTSEKRFSARYCVIAGEGKVISKGSLSATGNNKREWGNGYLLQGDYFTGGFFHAGGRLNFLAQWTEPDGIKGNIISVMPEKKEQPMKVMRTPMVTNPDVIKEPVKNIKVRG
jgi:hypothetical protein